MNGKAAIAWHRNKLCRDPIPPHYANAEIILRPTRVSTVPGYTTRAAHRDPCVAEPLRSFSYANSHPQRIELMWDITSSRNR